MPKGKRIEPLDLEEMASSPSLNGLMDFRSAPPIGLAPTGLTPSTRKHEPSTPAHNLLKKHTNTYKNSASSPIGLMPIGEDDSTVSLDAVLNQLAATPPAVRSRGKIVPATKVEDGHSATQNSVYWFLWRKGQPVNGSRSHFIQAGYGQIQSALGIDRSNIQDAVRELQKKLALKIVKNSTVGSATVYEVFSCESILEKRRAEGLLWAHRYGSRRVELLSNPIEDPVENKFLTPIGPKPIGFQPGIGVTPTVSGGVTPIEGIGVTPIHSVKGVNSKTSSSEIHAVRSFVAKALDDDMDEDAAEKLLADCRTRAGNQPVTVDQVIVAVQKKLRAAHKAHNPIGFLLIAVPKQFPNRMATTVQDLQQREGVAEDYAYWEQVLDDPNATESLIRTARGILAGRS